MEFFKNRCIDTYKDDRGVIIPIVDEDIISMLDGFVENGSEVWETLLTERFRKIAFQ